MLLVIGTSVDSHIDAVLAHLPPTLQFYRLNVDHFPVTTQLSWSFDNNGVQDFRTAGVLSNLSDVSVVWFRRQGMPTISSDIREPGHRLFAHNETEGFLNSLDGMFPHARWINRYAAVKRALSKPLQLVIAQSCGLAVPPTLVTNSPADAARFLAAHPDAVYKTLVSPSVTYDSYRALIFTHRLSVEDSVKLSNVQHAPCMFQAYIQKDHELRITYTGKNFYAAKIYSQETQNGTVDWRAAGLSELRYDTAVLPTQVMHRLQRFVEALNLQYAAIDMIVTPKGDYVFLEANPHGAWLWLENAVTVPISASLANFITQG